jgi:hypothetical protein
MLAWFTPEMEAPGRIAMEFGIQFERRIGLATNPAQEHGETIDEPSVA